MVKLYKGRKMKRKGKFDNSLKGSYYFIVSAFKTSPTELIMCLMDTQ